MKFLKLFHNKQKESVTDEGQLLIYRRTDDVRLLGELYQRYMEMVFEICFSYLREEEESKDAVMQIFEKLVATLKTHEVANFKSWLHSVTRNHCLMLLRARRVFSTASDIPESDQQLLFSEGYGETIRLDQDLTALEKCMETLIQEQRESISLFYLKEKCYREISEQTGFDMNKVKSYIQNGKRNLKICMDKNGSN